MPNSLGDRRFEVEKIDRLGHEIKGAAVHRGADVGHVAIGRDDDGRQLFLALLQLLQQRQPVHPRHVDVGDHQVDVAVGLERRQGFDAVTGEQKADGSIANLVPELLLDERLQIRLVVDDQDIVRSCGAFDPRFDFIAEHHKVDGFGQKRLSAALQAPCAWSPHRHRR